MSEGLFSSDGAIVHRRIRQLLAMIERAERGGSQTGQLIRELRALKAQRTATHYEANDFA